MSQFPLFFTMTNGIRPSYNIYQKSRAHTENKGLELEKWKNCSKDLREIPEI